MKLFTEAQYQQLLQNGQPENRDKDHYPVVKLFGPDTGATWLLTEIDPNAPEMAFGLCDFGFPKLGNVYLPELMALRGKLRLPVERDLNFEAAHPISVYVRAVQCVEHIVTYKDQLDQAAAV